MSIGTTHLRTSILAAALASAFVLVPNTGFAQQRGQQRGQRAAQACPESSQQAQARTRRLREVSGRVLQTKLVEIRGMDEPNLVALIATRRGNGRLVVDLGPRAQVRRANIQPGDTIAVRGVVHRIGDKQLLVAERLRTDQGQLAIGRRDQERQFALMQREERQQRRAEANRSQRQRRTTR